MDNWIKSMIVLCTYFILFFSFGSLITCRKDRGGKSVGLTVLIGFFLYHIIFQIITIPLMFALQPLSRLTLLWTVLALGIVLFSVWKNHKVWGRIFRDLWRNVCGKTVYERLWRLAAVAIVLANVLAVSLIYSSYWDATYYVGSVSYSVYHNTINTINPLLGAAFETFDLKHCLATYHMNDAVFCQLFSLHPLIETKTVMVIVVTILLNLIYSCFADFFFPGNPRAKALFLGFGFLINLCTFSDYTSSAFVLLRTYEGKAIAGAVVAPFLFYWFIRLFRSAGKIEWEGLFIVSWGAVAVSSSAMFLVPAALGIFAVVQWVRTRHFRVVLCSMACMVPAGVVLACYLLNRLGLLYIYTSR